MGGFISAHTLLNLINIEFLVCIRKYKHTRLSCFCCYSSLRLWAVSGQVLMEMVGHTAIVYSVDSHASGLIVSGSEDHYAKIWKGDYMFLAFWYRDNVSLEYFLHILLKWWCSILDVWVCSVSYRINTGGLSWQSLWGRIFFWSRTLPYVSQQIWEIASHSAFSDQLQHSQFTCSALMFWVMPISTIAATNSCF